MSFQWTDYLTLAQNVVSAATDEASLRTAVSRAYYAAFHVARRYVMDAKPEVQLPADGRQHEMVWEVLGRGRRQERAACAHGRRLKQKRTKADYAMTGLKFPNDARFAITEAQGVISNIASARQAYGGP